MKFHSVEVSSIVTIKRVICVIKPYRTITICICGCFLKEIDGFHNSLLFLLALIFLCQNYSLLKVHNHALSWCRTFTLFFHNCHAHARIRVLVNIFSKDSQVWSKCSVVYHICQFNFQRRNKKLYTQRMKILEWKNLILPSLSPSPHYDYRTPFPPKTFWINSRFLFQI